MNAKEIEEDDSDEDDDDERKKTDENTKRIKRAPRLIRLESEIKIGFLEAMEWAHCNGLV